MTEQARIRELTKALRELSGAVSEALTLLDSEMRKPSDAGRGKRVALICNALDLVNDRVRYFQLGVDYRKDKDR